MSRVTLQTGPGVFEVLANVCRSHQEAVKQFVENSADAVQQAAGDEKHISIHLQYASDIDGAVRRLKNIVVADNGIGMNSDKMKYILGHIGNSEKVQMALKGEKGIGILAFSMVAEELHIASTDTDGTPSSCLVLKRPWLKIGKAEVVERCSRHTHYRRGTVVYLEDILPEVADKLTKERLKEYLGREFANDLMQGFYAMSISDNHEFEPVPPKRYRGIRAMSTVMSLGKFGSVTVDLHVLPWDMADATVSLYGRGGTRVCLLTDLEDFRALPWIDKRLEGYIRCDNLKRTADKTAVVPDQVYQAFVAELYRIEPEVREMIDRISASSLERRFEVVLGKTGRLVDRFLRYRERGLLADLPYRSRRLRKVAAAAGDKEESTHSAGRLTARRGPAGVHSLNLRLYSPPEEKAQSRSWFDRNSGCICVNREHSEFLLSQREDARCIRYLFTIWVKESLLEEYGSDAEKLADEMVGRLSEAEPLLW
ncbi:MAG: ATP-binding protein [Dehalococcoidales bacterium]|nr:ATP-binding protein [Dehalococcoidales bacterium]